MNLALSPHLALNPRPILTLTADSRTGCMLARPSARRGADRSKYPLKGISVAHSRLCAGGNYKSPPPWETCPQLPPTACGFRPRRLPASRSLASVTRSRTVSSCAGNLISGKCSSRRFNRDRNSIMNRRRKRFPSRSNHPPIPNADSSGAGR